MVKRPALVVDTIKQKTVVVAPTFSVEIKGARMLPQLRDILRSVETKAN